MLRFGWRWGLRPPLILVALFFILSWGGKAFHAVRSATMTETEGLTEDLQRLERILTLEHPAPFRNGSQREVEDAFDRARSAIDRFERGELREERVLAHFVEAVASLHDPHTTFAGRYDAFGILRVEFGVFEGDVRILAAPDSAFLGARVLAFEETPTADVLEGMRRLIPYANESGFLRTVSGFLRTPALLHHIGATADPGRATLHVLHADGSPAELALPRITLEDFRDQPPIPIVLEDGTLPLYRRADPAPYWFEALPERDALYIRFARSASSETPLSELAAQALRVRDSLGLGPVVIDLRGNRGGDPQAHIPLVSALAASAETRGPAHLRVLVNGGTFSAAVVAAGDLERRTGALLVGEEPGDRAHLTTDPRPFTLRNSGVEIWVPTGLLRTPGGAGGRSRLTPARPTRLTFEDWRAGRDPALEEALAPYDGFEPYGAPEAGSETAPRDAEPVEAELPTGQFAFDAQRALTLSRDAGGYRATVTGLGSDRLSPGPDGVWSGGIHFGFRVDAGGFLAQRLPDGTWVALPPLENQAPLELALSGQVVEASAAYRELTSDGTDRARVASLGLLAEGVYRYAQGENEPGRTLFTLAQQLSPADPLIPLQHALLRRVAEDRWIPPADEFFRAARSCARRYAGVTVLNDWRLCL